MAWTLIDLNLDLDLARSISDLGESSESEVYLLLTATDKAHNLLQFHTNTLTFAKLKVVESTLQTTNRQNGKRLIPRDCCIACAPSPGEPHGLSNRSAPYHIREEERRRPPRPFVFILSLATDMVWCPTVAHKENTPYDRPKRPPFPRQVVLCDVSEQVLWPILEISLKFTSLCAFRGVSRSGGWF